MEQASLDDEELFGEAAEDLRSDVEASLTEARSSLPDPEAIWHPDGENVVGIMNALRSAMDPGEAEANLREAKKWYTMGNRADAFDDAEDLAADIEQLEDLLDKLVETREDLSELAGTIPDLRSTLEATVTAEESATDGATDEGADTTTEDETEEGDPATDGGSGEGQATLQGE